MPSLESQLIFRRVNVIECLLKVQYFFTLSFFYFPSFFIFSHTLFAYLIILS